MHRPLIGRQRETFATAKTVLQPRSTSAGGDESDTSFAGCSAAVYTIVYAPALESQ